MSNLEEILKKLVRYPTISEDQESNRVALDFIENYLKIRGMQIWRLQSQGFESLVATIRPSKTPIVFLAGHLDVVPAPKELFNLHKEEGKLYGRGVLDMKSAIAVYMNLIDKLKNHLKDYDFGIMITTDEEIYGDNGTGYLVKKGFLPEVVVLPDGGNNWKVESFAKGILRFKITTDGLKAHGSRPWEGESAAIKMLDLLHEIRLLLPEAKPETNLLNIGIIQGGLASNQIPDFMEAQIDIRTISTRDHVRLKKEIFLLCQKYEACIEILRETDVTITDLKNPFVQQFREIIAKHTGVKETTISYAASDARYFAANGIPVIVFYPPGGGHHSDKEWIEAQALDDFDLIIYDFIAKVARI